MQVSRTQQVSDEFTKYVAASELYDRLTNKQKIERYGTANPRERRLTESYESYKDRLELMKVADKLKLKYGTKGFQMKFGV